jgi:hypothetical protein
MSRLPLYKQIQPALLKFLDSTKNCEVGLPPTAHSTAEVFARFKRIYEIEGGQMRHTSVSQSAVRRALRDLASQGKVRCHKSGRANLWVTESAIAARKAYTAKQSEQAQAQRSAMEQAALRLTALGYPCRFDGAEISFDDLEVVTCLIKTLAE